MNIETKFNMGDDVFFINKNEIIKRKVHKIDVQITEFWISIEYSFLIEEGLTLMDENEIHICNEEGCFKTTKELVEYYENKINK